MGNDTYPAIPFQEGEFLKKSMKKGAGKYFSICNFHPYTNHSYVSIASFEQHLKLVLAGMQHAYDYAKNVCDKPIWFTEFGITNWGCRLTPDEIAKVYYLSFQWCRKRKIPLFLWTLHDFKKTQVSALNPERNFGLLDVNLKPKKVYSAVVEQFSVIN